MKKLLIVVLCFCGLHLKAQDYEQAIGLRGGLFAGVTYKHHLESNNYLEALLEGHYDGFVATGIYEWVFPFEVQRFNWYAGVGAHVGIWDNEYLALGPSGIIGIEYTIDEIPLNLSLDWKPSFDIFTNIYFRGSDIALSVRYYF
jgi:hypothetical protein